ncbi:lipoic acid synthetase [Caldicoprobacter guelmensis]|uniref:lipoyl synthase n=1 Tax=Caldicoprobacter guelmensis TaxID=1170224 RepID=UPI00195B1A81|nr:lipoyl synthase [Caldicoprobacter guelmensis]MBM7581628.1 lipoic acid synthetase [Caldicoprobacter guelmensis]
MHSRKPEWLRIRVQSGHQRNQVKKLLNSLSLHTVCEEANCPNLMECFSKGTATFMILGNICTRNCTFCNVRKGHVQPVDPQEPMRIAQAVSALQIKHAVITSVTRDDLPDGGASHFAEVVEQVKKLCPEVTVEVLIPDFQGNLEALEKVVKAGPEVVSHNIETVPRLYPYVRPQASYHRSLNLLKNVKKIDHGIFTKSGLMVGLGEKFEEVVAVMKDLRNCGCDFLTIGQYLAPSPFHHPVVEYIHPNIFEEYKHIALEMGFLFVAAGPLVRSSYHAEKALELTDI